MKAAAVVALSGPAKRESTAPATAPKKTKVKKPGPQSDDQIFWLYFSELRKYKVEHGTRSVPQSKDSTYNILAN
jgi:hypothetical protein